MDTQEAVRIQTSLEQAVLRSIRSNLKSLVHKAILEVIESEVKEGPEQPKDRSKEDRQVRNYVRYPKPGGRCHAVWMELDKLGEQDGADLPAILKVAKKKGWNINNTRVEFYRWRKFHQN
jgi:hypothetical protein